MLVADRIYVRPPWEQPVGAEIDLEIDPGRAFGTGSHSTTRLCLALLVEVEPGGSAVDLGCGSGVLAIAAARLGFGPVTALDADPLAVEATGAERARSTASSLDRVGRANLRERAGARRRPGHGQPDAPAAAARGRADDGAARGR